MSIKKIISIALLLMITHTVTAQTKSDETYNEDKQNIMITSAHPEFTIQLKSNPTTGYAWFLREYNSNLILPVKRQFKKSEQKLIGAPGYELWTFRVKPAGFLVPQQTILRMVYLRPWQGNENSTQLIFRIMTSKE